MDDLISRQAAIDALPLKEKGLGGESWMMTYRRSGWNDCIEEVKKAIDKLPTAEPRKGKWIIQSNTYHEYWECDQCGMGVGLDDVRNYCPNCGAKMEESE